MIKIMKIMKIMRMTKIMKMAKMAKMKMEMWSGLPDILLGLSANV